ncbi:uncharacterized protein LOC134285167 [Aedes albopictus]|uniref:Endonuclease/exonuclease/phosphatase domain-containing protein n=1 Tax=Aedes albopictus TaxID=7160 RepID=A0ABM1Z119_AEDAL
MMEALKPFDTVEPSRFSLSADCSGRPSRSVPVFEIGEEGFQLAHSGKYPNNRVPSSVESRPIPSTNDDNAHAMSTHFHLPTECPANGTISSVSKRLQSSTTERTPRSMIEAPKPPDTVELSRFYSSADCSGHPSRSVPVFGIGEGGFQLARSGNLDVCDMPSSRAANRQLDPSEDRIWAYYHNVRGLRTKIDDLFLASSDCGMDIIFLTETGLDSSIDSLQLFGGDYNVFRCDRNALNSNKASFGGVLIAVAKRFPSSVVNVEHGDQLEQVCVSATIKGSRLYLASLYLPPDRSRDSRTMELHIASIRELCERSDRVLVCGDYNQPRLDWLAADCSVSVAESSSLNAASTVLLDGMDFLNLSQRNAVRNELGRTLDLVFYSVENDMEIDESAVSLLPIDSHHPPLVLSLSSTFAQPAQIERNIEVRPLDFRKIDFAIFSQFLSNRDWDDVLQCTDVDDMTMRFCGIIKDWLELNVPRKKRRFSPAWSTPLLRRLKRDRNSAQRKLRNNNTVDNKRNFKHASTVYCRLNSSLYKSHVLRVQWNLRRNPSSFWSFVNSKRKNSSILLMCDLVIERQPVLRKHVSYLQNTSHQSSNGVELATRKRSLQQVMYRRTP